MVHLTRAVIIVTLNANLECSGHKAQGTRHRVSFSQDKQTSRFGGKEREAVGNECNVHGL